MPRRKQSYDDDSSLYPPPQGGQGGSSPSQGGQDGSPILGYFDISLIHEFIEQYSPGNYQHCDVLMTEPMLRDLFNAQRDQDMTFTDPWIQYKESLKSQGYQLRPNAQLGCSVMYLLNNEPEDLEPLE